MVIEVILSLIEMPEWSTDADMDELGTFDASGAFVSTHSKHHFKVRVLILNVDGGKSY